MALPTLPIDESRHESLRSDGFCILPGMVSPSLLATLRDATDRVLERLPEDRRLRDRLTGSMVPIQEAPQAANLIALPGLLEGLATLGFPDARWASGYIISKPPGGPRLFWHQDWWGWDHDISYTSQPLHLFVMCYLSNTSRANGCLRVVPGSHRKRHALHDLIAPAHTDAARNIGDADAMLQDADGEIDVPVTAGDLVVGDARLLHAAHANSSDKRRTCITLWFVPDMKQLPESLQARYARNNVRSKPDNWSPAQWSLVEPIIPRFEGDVAEASPNRTPDARLK